VEDTEKGRVPMVDAVERGRDSSNIGVGGKERSTDGRKWAFLGRGVLSCSAESECADDRTVVCDDLTVERDDRLGIGSVGGGEMDLGRC
jgi:hypothetical protein